MKPINRRSILAGIAAVPLSQVANAASQKPLIVITGDLGTVGKRLVSLLAPDYSIFGIDKKRGIQEDLTSPDGRGPLMPTGPMYGAVAIIHLAWDTSLHADTSGILYNAWITRSALLTVWKWKIPRFIFASSAWAAPEMYGRKGGIEPTPHYTESKVFLEGMLADYSRASGIPTPCIRFGQVNPVGNNDPSAPFDSKIVMGDSDLRGLIDIAMRARSGVIGPFDARA